MFSVRDITTPACALKVPDEDKDMFEMNITHAIQKALKPTGLAADADAIEVVWAEHGSVIIGVEVELPYALKLLGDEELQRDLAIRSCVLGSQSPTLAKIVDEGDGAAEPDLQQHVAALRRGSPEVQAYAALSLDALASHTPAAREAIVAAGAVEPLRELARCGNVQAQEAAERTLAGLPWRQLLLLRGASAATAIVAVVACDQASEWLLSGGAPSTPMLNACALTGFLALVAWAVGPWAVGGGASYVGGASAGGGPLYVGGPSAGGGPQ
jgi:hypothetical protein